MKTQTNAQLTTAYNQLATQLEIPTIAIWKGKKEVIEARIVELQVRVSQLRHQDRYEKKKATKKAVKVETPAVEEVPTEEAPVEVPAKMPKPLAEGSKIDPVLVTFLEGAPKDQKPAVSLRNALKMFPGVTRIQFKHSAIAAGFNGLTARNMFDRINKK